MTKNYKISSIFVIILVSLIVLSSCTGGNNQTIQSKLPITSITYTQVINSSTDQITPTSPTHTQSDITQRAKPNSPSTGTTAQLNPTPAKTAVITSPTPLPPDYWMSLPVIPVVSDTAREIYNQGIEMGRDSHAFSKIGDCQSVNTYFLNNFEIPTLYNLGEYSNLQETIDWYSGSFTRKSMAVKGGFNAAAILSPLRSDPTQCKSDENPVACEYRLHNPSIALISLEEWWSNHPENYEKYMRQIIEYSIQQGVLPILATKADNIEGNNLINQTITKLALEYDIPIWNFWRAVQPLPNHGLIIKDTKGRPDGFHLTHSENFYFYDNPSAEKSGWSVRNLTALQALDAVRRGLTDKP